MKQDAGALPVSYSINVHISKEQCYMQLFSNKIACKDFFAYVVSDDIVSFYFLFSNLVDSGEKNPNLFICSCHLQRKSYFYE